MSWNIPVDAAQNAAQSAANYSPGEGEWDGTIFESWLMPGNVQQREFGQQVALTQMQNEWNSEQAKMQRAIEAGINPNTAASAIAGSSTSSAAPSPSSSVGAGAAGVGSAAQSIQSAASAVDAASNATEKLSLLDTVRREKRANVAKLLSEAGVNKWQAKSIAEMLPLNKEGKMADIYQTLAETDNIREEWHNIKLEHDKKLSEIGKIDEERRYYQSLGDVAKATECQLRADTERINIQNWFSTRDKEFREKYGFNRDDPTKVALLSAILAGNDDLASTIANVVDTESYSIESGKLRADVENAYDLAYQELKGSNDVKAQFEPYFQALEAQKGAIIELYKMIIENPSDIKGFLSKLINVICNVGSAYAVDLNDVSTASKPLKGKN